MDNWKVTFFHISVIIQITPIIKMEWSRLSERKLGYIRTLILKFFSVHNLSLVDDYHMFYCHIAQLARASDFGSEGWGFELL